MKHFLNNKVCMLITKAERCFQQGNFLRASGSEEYGNTGFGVFKWGYKIRKIFS